MDIGPLLAYLPMDRRHSLAAGRSLPDRTEGSVLFADISGFTPLTTALVGAFGPRRGAEELALLLNRVYDVLVVEAHRYGGSIICFSGDGFLSWFASDDGRRAAACGLAMQQAMAPFAAAETPGHGPVTLSLKVAIAAGPVRRFLVGDPDIQVLEVLAGGTLDRVAQTGAAVQRGEVAMDNPLAEALGPQVVAAERRGPAAVLAGLAVEVPSRPWPAVDIPAIAPAAARPYVPTPVYERLAAGQGEYLAELRPIVAVFLRFGGIDYDADDDAGYRLDAYIRRAQQTLARYDGFLMQLSTGDKGTYLYISFGALAAHEDDAARAVAAAMELRRPPTEQAYIRDVQIGISQGQVWAGSYGGQNRRTYAPLGDEVNVAARLMQAAPAGEVRCSERVQRAAIPRWSFQPLPEIRVKGKQAPLHVYRPLEIAARRAAHSSLPLVGRQTELAALSDCLLEACAGQQRIVLLQGEAGIGKSRLVEEVARFAAARGVRWLAGAGQSIERSTPYRAWRDLLNSYWDLDERTDLGECQRRVLEQVATVQPSMVERAPLLNDILALELPENNLTRSLDPKTRQQSLAVLMADLLRKEAHRQPLALVLEDAHWLDSLSWELTLTLARTLVDEPVLLLVVLRPMEEPQRREYTALAHMAGARQLSLETMPPAETVELAAARLGVAPGDLPAEVSTLIRERAGGNPFFAEEVAYALRDMEAIAVTAGQCTLQTSLDALHESVPVTVEGVVLARIDRLPPEVQLTLKVAAVIGRGFLYRTLLDIHPRQVLADLLRAHLEQLGRRDLTPLESLEPELTYVFKHVITQQVSYDTLLFAQRRELHRTVAQWYERIYAGNLAPYCDLLAHHWSRAENCERERHYCHLAGEQAAARFANAEAVHHLSRALELHPADDPAGRYALLLARERVYSLQGDRQAQSRDLAMIAELAETIGQDRERATAALRWADYYDLTSDYPAAIAAAQNATALAVRARATEIESAADIVWGSSLWLQGHYSLARERFEHALELARRSGDRKRQADCLHHLGILHLEQGAYEQSLDCLQRTLALRRTSGDRFGEARTLNTLANLYQTMGDPRTAIAYQQESLSAKRTIGDRLGESASLYNLSLLHVDLAQRKEALRCCEEALAITRSVDSPRIEAYALTYLALLREHPHIHKDATADDLAAAHDAYAQALAIRQQIGQPALGVDCLAGLARVAMARNQMDEALARTGEALDWIARNGTDGIGDVFLVYQTAYQVYGATGQGDRARQVLTTAYHLLQEMARQAPSEAARRAFLETVWPNREIVADYRALENP